MHRVSRGAAAGGVAGASAGGVTVSNGSAWRLRRGRRGSLGRWLVGRHVRIGNHGRCVCGRIGGRRGIECIRCRGLGGRRRCRGVGGWRHRFEWVAGRLPLGRRGSLCRRLPSAGMAGSGITGAASAGASAGGAVSNASGVAGSAAGGVAGASAGGVTVSNGSLGACGSVGGSLGRRLGIRRRRVGRHGRIGDRRCGIDRRIDWRSGGVECIWCRGAR